MVVKHRVLPSDVARSVCFAFILVPKTNVNRLGWHFLAENLPRDSSPRAFLGSPQPDQKMVQNSSLLDAEDIIFGRPAKIIFCVRFACCIEVLKTL